MNEKMKVIALCSTPRFGLMDFMGQTLVACGLNVVGYKNLFGAYWSHTLEGGMREADGGPCPST